MMVGWLSFVSWCSCCIVGCSLSSVPTDSLPRNERAAHLGWPLALSSVLVLSFHGIKTPLSLSLLSHLLLPLLVLLLLLLLPFFCLSHRRGSPVFHINTQIPWRRPRDRARVYTGTTAAFHDTRPPPPPFSRRFLCTFVSLPHLPLRSSTLPSCIITDTTARAAGKAPIFGDSLPLAVFERPPAGLSRTIPLSHLLSIGRATSVSLSIEDLALRARRHRMLS